MENSKRQFLTDSSKVLLFLGAGSSAPFGRQTFSTFKTLFTEDNLGRDVKSYLDKIILSMDLAGKRSDIEGILWQLQNYLDVEKTALSDSLFGDVLYSKTVQISRLNSFFEKVRTTKAAIQRIKTSHYGHFSEQKRNAIEGKLKSQYDFYKKIAALNDDNLHIVTTNYDMALEEMWVAKRLEDPEMDLVTGIGGDFLNKGYGTWDPSVYDMIPDKGRCGWHLYRLHGCTHWFFGQGSMCYSRKKPANPFDIPCIMDPGTTFNIGDEPFRTAFNKFELLLKECKLCVFIGFSFHDKDVLEILLHVSTTRSKPLHILTVNKNPGIDAAFLRKTLRGVAKPCPMNYDHESLKIDSFTGPIENKEAQTKILYRIRRNLP